LIRGALSTGCSLAALFGPAPGIAQVSTDSVGPTQEKAYRVVEIYRTSAKADPDEARIRDVLIERDAVQWVIELPQLLPIDARNSLWPVLPLGVCVLGAKGNEAVLGSFVRAIAAWNSKITVLDSGQDAMPICTKSTSANVRIAFDQASNTKFSEIGTMSSSSAWNVATMHFPTSWLDNNPAVDEAKPLVLRDITHEFGHALGFYHGIQHRICATSLDLDAASRKFYKGEQSLKPRAHEWVGNDAFRHQFATVLNSRLMPDEPSETIVNQDLDPALFQDDFACLKRLPASITTSDRSLLLAAYRPASGVYKLVAAAKR
jgi:hypothetical protein